MCAQRLVKRAIHSRSVHLGVERYLADFDLMLFRKRGDRFHVAKSIQQHFGRAVFNIIFFTRHQQANPGTDKRNWRFLLCTHDLFILSIIRVNTVHVQRAL